MIFGKMRMYVNSNSRCWRFVILALTLFAYQGTAQEDINSSDKLESIIEEAWSFRSTPCPLDPKSNKDDPRLRDMSKESIEARGVFWKTVQSKLASIDPAFLNSDENINLTIFRFIVEEEVNGYQYKTYLTPFNAEGGFHTGFGFNANATLRDEKSLDEYLVKLTGFMKLVEQQIVLLRDAITLGYIMPEVIMKNFDLTASTYVTSDVSQSIFSRPLIQAKEHMAPDLYSKAQGEIYDAIEKSVNPGYELLADFLREEYVPACRTSIGAIDFPNGSDYYIQRVKHFTTLDMSPKEVFDIGMSEVDRIHAQMQKIIEELEYEGSFQDFLHFLRTDEQFYAQTPHQLLAEASYFAKKIDGKLPAYFDVLPRLSYGVEPVPDEIAPRYTSGRYAPGSAKRHRSGTYWVNTYQLESRPLYALPSLTLHEAVPGHHLQFSIAGEIEGLPEFRSQYYISAFGEGWGLYSEFLGKEMGIYETLYQEFGALTYEMWRACRLVVDPGMHAMGWSREQAMSFMAENTALSMHEINTEIDRYIGWPGQAVSYKIGELTIRRLREEAEKELGPKFNIRRFHQIVLVNGSVPLFLLEELIHDWITTQEESFE